MEGMMFDMGEKAGISSQRGFWLRCFLGKAWFAMAVWLAAFSLLWAKVEMPGPLHLWRIHGFFVNPVGKPLENVEVTLVRDGTVLHRTKTDGAGGFSFDHVYGRYWLHIDKSEYSQLSREVIVGLETVTLLRRNTLYVIAGPGACADDCSSVFTSRSDFERTIRRNAAQHD
jgi:hypothetical protein